MVFTYEIETIRFVFRKQRTGIAVRRLAVELIKVRLNKVLTFSGGGVEEKKVS